MGKGLIWGKQGIIGVINKGTSLLVVLNNNIPQKFSRGVFQTA
jgi:hypothetical protein